MKNLSVLALALLLTTAAYGQRGGHGPGGGPGGDPGTAPGGNLIVADDGTVIVSRVVSDSATNTRTQQLTAYTSAGAQAWSVTLTNGGHPVLSGSNLLFVSHDNTAGTSTISARSLASGAEAWTKTVTGRITDLEPFSGGTYAVVVVPPATQGGTGTRSLAAISASGATLWSVPL
jgi:hypothetical protein